MPRTNVEDVRRKLRAQLAVTRALSDARSIVDSAHGLLEALCETLDWQAGLLWTAGPGAWVLECAGAWAADARSTAFCDASRELHLSLGEDIPGEVCQSGEAVWIRDVVAHPGFRRRAAAEDAGFHSCLAVCIRDQSGAAAILELFTTARLDPDQGILDLVSGIVGQVGQFAGKDTTDRSLRDAVAIHDAVLVSAPDALVVMDARGVILEMNRAAEAMFGYSRALALGKRVADLFIPAALREAHDAGLARYLQTGQAKIIGSRYETTALRISGKEFPVELTVTPIDGLPEILFAAQIRDISGRKQKEEVDARAADLQAELLGLISHELRSPLASIAANIEVLNRSAAADDEDRAILAEIAQSTERLNRVVSHMLSLGRISSDVVPCEPVLLQHLVRTVVDRFVETYGRAVHLDIAHPLPPVLAEPTFVDQVADNFLSNAHKYSPEGKPLHVSVGRNGNHIEVLVRDEGEGLPGDQLARLFDPFFRAERTAARAHGIGLGLTVCKRLVQAQRGRIWAISPAEGGTAFGFSLPLAEDGDPS